MLARARSLVGQSAIYGLGNLMVGGIAFFLVPLYTRVLTTADYGILAVASTFTSVVGIFLQFGLQGAVTRFHYDYLDDERERRRYYGTIWLTLMVGGLLLSLLVDWQGDRLFRLLFPGVPYSPYGRLSLWSAYLTVTSVIPLVLFRVREQASRYILATTAQALVTTLLIVLFVVILRRGVIGNLEGQLIEAGLLAVPFVLVTLRNIRLAFDWAKLKASFAFGLPMIPHQLSGWALSVSDRIVLAQYVSLDQIGLYSLGYRFATMLDLILQSINLAWAPFFYRTAATDRDAPRTFARLGTYYTVFLLFLSLGTALLSPDVIKLIARPAYHAAGKVVPVVVLAFLAHGFYFMVVNQLFYMKQTKRLPLYTGLSAAVNIGLNVLLVPRLGIMAAAWNTTLGYVLLFLLVFRDSNRLYPIRYEYRRLAFLLLTAGLVFAAGALVRLDKPLLSLTARLVLLGTFPAALLVFRFFSPQERTGMRKLLGLRGR